MDKDRRAYWVEHVQVSPRHQYIEPLSQHAVLRRQALRHVVQRAARLRVADHAPEISRKRPGQVRGARQQLVFLLLL